MAPLRRSLLAGACMLALAVISVATPFWRWTRDAGGRLLGPWLSWNYSLTHGIRSLVQVGDLQRENDNFRDELARLSAVDAARQAVDSQRRELEALAGLPIPHGFRTVSAAVVGQRSDDTGTRYILNRGRSDGLAVGMPVVVGLTQGIELSPTALLIGLIADTSDAVASFTTTTSPFTYVAVDVLSEPKQTALAHGEFNLAIRLELLPASSAVPPGAAVVSGNLNELVPPGLLIGRVSSVEQPASDFFSNGIVAPPAPPERFRFVKILIPK